MTDAIAYCVMWFDWKGRERMKDQVGHFCSIVTVLTWCPYMCHTDSHRSLVSK